MMLVFYLISLPLTMGMVILTLRYFAGPAVPIYVLLTVGYTWFCSFSIIILVPTDIWTVISLVLLNMIHIYHYIYMCVCVFSLQCAVFLVKPFPLFSIIDWI